MLDSFVKSALAIGNGGLCKSINFQQEGGGSATLGLIERSPSTMPPGLHTRNNRGFSAAFLGKPIVIRAFIAPQFFMSRLVLTRQEDISIR